MIYTFMIKIVVGLGNPTDKYKDTRHNIGFMVLDELSNEYGFSFAESDKFKCMIGEQNINGEKVYFIKPLTYMNLSGVSVAALSNFYKIKPEEILVIHDEMNIPFGKLKLRHDGSAGGHNGISSIIDNLGSQKFPRLKVGIDRNKGQDTVSYVLGKFKPEEKEVLEEFINKAKNSVKLVLESDITKAMNEINR